jgi:hypothetical protein
VYQDSPVFDVYRNIFHLILLAKNCLHEFRHLMKMP